MTSKNKSWLLIPILILLFAFKKKSGSSQVIIEPYESAPNSDAEFLVGLKAGTPYLYNDKVTQAGVFTNAIKLDGWSSTDSNYIVVRLANQKYYVKRQQVSSTTNN